MELVSLLLSSLFSCNFSNLNGKVPLTVSLALLCMTMQEEVFKLAQRLDYLLKDFGYKISYSTLKALNRKFRVDMVKKPPPEHIASTLIGEVMMNNVSSRNGPRTIQTQISLQNGIKIPRDMVRRLMADIDPDGAEARFPGHRRQSKVRGHLTDTGVHYELHFDGHEKLNFKALRTDGICWHRYLRLTLPFKQQNGQLQNMVATVDGGSETGELYAAHVALRQHVMPYISVDDAPLLVAMKSTDNIPIESSWHLFTNYIGLDIKQIILLGKSLNYLNSFLPLHM
ncbi:hypothetical protein B0H13DRAFT_2305344 [Mycena leptocephala]|nr:hypothetical protein B0H13DRAFT_2305344 [Mycena leptocephala]